MNPLEAAEIVQRYGDWATLWMQRLWLTSWQGGCFILVVWLMCRLLPQMPARTQRWLWRIVYCKLLIGLFWFTPISLPLISVRSDAPTHSPVVRNRDRGNSLTGQRLNSTVPAPIAASPGQKLNQAAKLEAAKLEAAKLEAAKLEAAKLDEVAKDIDAESMQRLNHKTPQGPPPSALGTKLSEVYLQGLLPNDAETFLIIVVDILWASGVCCCLVALLLQVRHLRRLRKRARSLAGTPLAAVMDELTRQIGLRRSPRLVASHDAEAPLIMGLFRPVIVIPELALNSYSAADLRLILMHELMHLRAGDLWWMPLAALTEMLCFFNPLVWLAGRNFSLVREAACDSAVLCASGTPAPEYARLLLMIVTAKPKRETFIATLSAAVGYHELKRRFALLQFAYGDASGPGLRLVLVVLIICGGVFLVPWRITASGAIVQRPYYTAFTLIPEIISLDGFDHRDTSRGLLIGETLAMPGQPQHLVASEYVRGDAHGYHLQMRDLGPVELRWFIVRRDGTKIFGPGQPNPMIVGRMPDQTLRDTRLHAQLSRGDAQGEAHLVSDFPRGSSSMEDTVIVSSQMVPPAGSSVEASFHQAWFSRNNRLTFLGTLPGGTYSTAVAYNYKGVVTGSADVADGTEHAYLWYNGIMQDLGSGHPQAISIDNQVVGYYRTSSGHKHACLWQNGTRVDLGTLGGTDSMANDINVVYELNADGTTHVLKQIVGEALNAEGAAHAFVYTNGTMSDLNDHVPFTTRLVLTSADFVRFNAIIAYGALPQALQSDHAIFQRHALQVSSEQQ